MPLLSFSREKKPNKASTGELVARDEPGPTKTTSIKPAGLPDEPNVDSSTIPFLSEIKTPLVWSPIEADKLLRNMKKCQHEIECDPDLAKNMSLSSIRWLLAIAKHDKVYLRLRDCMCTLKALYRRRIRRDKHIPSEYTLCTKINLTWALLADVFDPFILRYYQETQKGIKDPTKKERIEEMEKRIAAWKELRTGLAELGITNPRDPRQNFDGW